MFWKISGDVYPKLLSKNKRRKLISCYQNSNSGSMGRFFNQSAVSTFGLKVNMGGGGGGEHTKARVNRW